MNTIYLEKKFSLLPPLELADLERMTLLDLFAVCNYDPAHIAVAEPATVADTPPQFILSRCWADQHLNSDADL